MAKNAWFQDVFLKSLFDRWHNTKSGFWLTQKQTSICVDNMKVTTVLIPCDAVNNHNHNNYSCIFIDNAKTYNCVISYSKKNCCGYIDFFYQATEEEKQEFERKEELKKIQRKITKKGKIDIERYNNYMNELLLNISKIEKCMQEDINNNCFDYVEEDKKDIEYYQGIIKTLHTIMYS